jgi:hypothetical protein
MTEKIDDFSRSFRQYVICTCDHPAILRRVACRPAA